MITGDRQIVQSPAKYSFIHLFIYLFIYSPCHFPQKILVAWAWAPYDTNLFIVCSCNCTVVYFSTGISLNSNSY